MKISRSMQEAASNLVPWNLNKLTFNGGDINWHSERSPDYRLRNFRFKPDGTALYFADSDTIHEITLDTAWDLKTGTLTNSVSLSGFGVTAFDLYFKSDGLTVFITRNVEMYELSLSTAWDLDTLSFVKTIGLTAQTSAANTIFFKPDGTKMFIGDSNEVFEYSLSTAWDINTASYSSTHNQGALSNLNSLVFKSDGTQFYRRSKTTVAAYTMSSAWDVSTASFTTAYTIPANLTSGSILVGLDIKPDGSEMFLSLDYDEPTVIKLDLSTSWDVTSASFTTPSSDFYNFRSVLGIEVPKGIQFKPDGTRMFMCSNFKIYAYSLGTAWDISSSTFLNSPSFTNGITGFYFKPDGTALYFTNFDDTVDEYSLSSAWDLNTVSYVRTFAPIASQANDLTSITFKPDGTKMYLTGIDVSEFNLSTPWNISTASYVGKFTPSFLGYPQGIYFREDGGAFYVVYYLSNIAAESYLVECEVGTPWSIATSQQETVVDISQASANAVDVYFRDTGRKAYVLSDQFAHIISYDL